MSTIASSMVILMRTTSYLMCKLKMSTLPFVMVALMRTTGLVWISCILRRDHKHSPVCCLCSRQYDMRDDTSINIIININLNTNITINEQMKNNVIKLTHIQQGRSQKTELQHQIHIQRNLPNMWISFRSLPVFPARVGKGNRFAADDFKRSPLSLKQYVDFFWITSCISCMCGFKSRL